MLPFKGSQGVGVYFDHALTCGGRGGGGYVLMLLVTLVTSVYLILDCSSSS